MTDLEISKQLALAIGWKDCNIDPDVITIRDATPLNQKSTAGINLQVTGASSTTATGTSSAR